MRQRPEAAVDDGCLLDRVARWPEYRHWRELTPEVLQQVAERMGIDFATALVFDRLRRSREHSAVIRRLDLDAPAAQHRGPLPFLVAIVPGGFYVESPHTGADGSLVRDEAARLGCRTACVPLESFGALETNAAILRDWLVSQRAEPVVLVSVSKGSAEVKLALDRPDAAEVFRDVAGWVDLSGISHGTSLAGWLLARPVRSFLVRGLLWSRGHSFAVIAALDRKPGGMLDGPLCLPPQLRAIHVVGFPRIRHLTTALARRGHRRLSPLGPNDGAILLADVLRLPGTIYPVWGADHYMRPPGRDMRPLIGRILHHFAAPPASTPADVCVPTVRSLVQEPA
jgi:hypothetical protein